MYRRTFYVFRVVREEYTIKSKRNTTHNTIKYVQVLKKTGISEDSCKAIFLDSDIDMNGKIEFAEFDLLCAKADSMGVLPPLDAIVSQLRVVTGKSDSSDAPCCKVKSTLDHVLVAKVFSLLDQDSSGSIDSGEAVKILSRMGTLNSTQYYFYTHNS